MSTPEVKVPEATNAKDPVIANAAWAGRDRVPSDWNILPTEEDGVIEATNSSTGRVFNGTLADFNKNLRG